MRNASYVMYLLHMHGSLTCFPLDIGLPFPVGAFVPAQCRVRGMHQAGRPTGSLSQLGVLSPPNAGLRSATCRAGCRVSW